MNPTKKFDVTKMIGLYFLNRPKKLIVDNDRDNVAVRVRGGASLGRISVRVATTDCPDSNYNDNATQLDLNRSEETDAVSDTMLLVSDDEDDLHPIDNIIDDDTNDRSHKIQLGGNVRIEAVKFGDKPWQNCD